MRKLYEIFMILQIQKRIVSVETIRGKKMSFQKNTKVCNVQKIAHIDRFNSFKINSVNNFCINLSNTFSKTHGISITN